MLALGRARGRTVTAGVLLAAAALAALSQMALERRRHGRDPAWDLLYLPNGRYLKVASIGYAPLLADLIYLWSIQYYGMYDVRVRYDLVEHIYVNVIGELDPRYRDAYTLASLILIAEGKSPERAIRVLEAGMQRSPDDWLLPFEAGFIAFDSLRDYERAARFFETSAARPGAHPMARRFHAEMFNKMGDKRTSYDKWRNIYETAEDDFVREIAFSHAHDLRIEIDLDDLRAAVWEYRERRGSWPAALQAVVEEGILPAVPVDPDGRDYLYDPASGGLKSQSTYRLWRR
jgi:tetratricopeptide (TPR) repeat protein